MNHSDALRLQVAERYVLGELPKPVREEYEEHYFGCQQCASDLETAATFLNGSRSLFMAEALERKKARQPAPSVGGSFAWLRPSFALPIFALLALIVGIQNLVTIPRLKRPPNIAGVVQEGNFVSLIGAQSREQGTGSFHVHHGKPSVIEIDIPRASGSVSFVCILQDESGRSLYREHVCADDAKKSIYLIVPKGELPSGYYRVIIMGESPAISGALSQTEVGRLPFVIEEIP